METKKTKYMIPYIETNTQLNRAHRMRKDRELSHGIRCVLRVVDEDPGDSQESPKVLLHQSQSTSV